MMNIRIKVKYLLVIVLLLGILWIGKDILVGNALYLTGKLNLEEEPEKGVAYLWQYIRQFPGQDKAIDAFNKLLEQFPNYNNFMVVFPSFWSGGVMPLDELDQLARLNEDFVRLKKYHTKVELAKVQMKLAQVNYQAGNIQKTIAYYKDLLGVELSKSGTQPYWYQPVLMLSVIYFDQGQTDKALELLDKLDDNDQEVMALRAWIALTDRDYEAYRQNSILSGGEYMFFSNEYGFFTSVTMDKIYANLTGKEINLQGQITKLGQPLKNVLVLLQREDIFSSSLSYAKYISVTDEEGRYEFRDVLPGSYSLGIGLSLWRANDVIYRRPKGEFIIKEGVKLTKDLEFSAPLTIIEPDEVIYMDKLQPVTVRWEPYPDAAYYTLSLGIDRKDKGAFSMVVDSNIQDTTAIITVNDLQRIGRNLYTDAENFDPAIVLGLEQLPTKYFYGIEAYSADGQLISRNLDPYRQQSIQFAGEGLTAADQLFYAKKYPEAIQAYEKAIEVDPNDLHSLRILAMIKYLGYDIEKETGVIIGQDYPVALEYFKKVYELSQDEKDLHHIREACVKLKDWEAASKYTTMLIESSKVPGYLQRFLGRYRLYQGDLTGAETELLKALEGAGVGQEYLLPLYLLEDRKDDLLELIAQNPDKWAKYQRSLEAVLTKLDNQGLAEFYQLMQDGRILAAKASLPNTSTGEFYRALLLILHPGIEESLYGGYASVEIPEFKELIQILGTELVHSDFPEQY